MSGCGLAIRAASDSPLVEFTAFNTAWPAPVSLTIEAIRLMVRGSFDKRRLIVGGRAQLNCNANKWPLLDLSR
jgi:hypothetical protein